MSIKKEVAKTALTTTAGAAGTLLAGGTPAGALASGGVALLLSGLDSYARRAAASRFQRFTAAMEEATSNGDDGAVAQAIIGLDSDPKVRDLMLAAFRTLLDAVCESAIDAVARLVTDYLVQQKSADGFFKRAASLLVDLAEDEYSGMRSLIEVVRNNLTPGKLSYATARESSVTVGHQSDQPAVPYKVEVGQCAIEVVRLLQKHGFAGDRTGADASQNIGKSPNVLSVNLNVEDVLRLGTFLR